MNDKKFKVGDKVRIIDCRLIEPYELNKIGTIVKLNDYCGDGSNIGYVVDMGRPRRPNDECDNDTCWWVHKEHIELASRPNQQLEFEFMN